MGAPPLRALARTACTGKNSRGGWWCCRIRVRGLWGTDEGYFDDDFDASPPALRVPYLANATNATGVAPSTAVVAVVGDSDGGTLQC
jgi:hypothetical protein